MVLCSIVFGISDDNSGDLRNKNAKRGRREKKCSCLMSCFVIVGKMNKRVRKYIGIIVAILMYYAVHEGAHFICAVFLGVFKQINIMGIGVQISDNKSRAYI